VPKWPTHRNHPPLPPHLQSAAASSRLRLPRPWLMNCSTPPLPPPVVCVPGALFPTRSTHSTGHRLQPVSSASPGPLRYARCPPTPLPLCSPRSLRECRRHPHSWHRLHTTTATASHCRRPHHYAGTHPSHYHNWSGLPPPREKLRAFFNCRHPCQATKASQSVEQGRRKVTK
jgi:hypothetical protein